MEQIPLLTNLSDVSKFMSAVKRVCELRHSFFPSWSNWVERLHRRPNPDVLEGFPGAHSEAAQEMGRDVWSIYVLKIKEAVQSTVDRAGRETDNLLLRASIVAFDMLREAKGQMSTRTFTLLESVTHPVAAKDWKSVPDRCRAWENDLTDYQNLTGLSTDPNLKTEAFLRILPTDLKNLALSQHGLDRQYESLRDYTFHQIGRRAALDTYASDHRNSQHQTDAPVPMDISAMISKTPNGNNAYVSIGSDEPDWHESSTENAFWYGKAGKGGKNGGGMKGKGKGADTQKGADAMSRGPLCWNCNLHGHRSWECTKKGRQEQRTGKMGPDVWVGLGRKWS